MGTLPNAKHEIFAQGLAKGLSASEAYVTAGYKPNDGNAIRLKGNEKVAARVAELVDAGAERATVSVERVLSELARLGFSDIRRAFTKSGQLRPVHEWDDDFAASVASVEVVTKPGAEIDEDGNREIEYVHKIKVWDKNSALEKLAKHLGMFVDRHDHTSSDGSMTPKMIQLVPLSDDDSSG